MLINNPLDYDTLSNVKSLLTFRKSFLSLYSGFEESEDLVSVPESYTLEKLKDLKILLKYWIAPHAVLL